MDSLLYDINIQQILNFLAIVDKNGFQAAAEYLNMTQSAVSRSVAKLEDLLGVTLFQYERKGSRVFRTPELTEDGKFLYDNWKSAIDLIERSYALMLQKKNTTEKTINVAYSNHSRSGVYYWPQMDRFNEEHEEITVNTSSDYRALLIPALKEEKYDLVFVPDIEVSSIDPETMKYRYIRIDEAAVLVSNRHRLFMKKELSLTDLNGETILGMEDDYESSSLLFVQDFIKRNDISASCKSVKSDSYNIGNTLIKHNSLIITDQMIYLEQTDRIRQIPLKGFYGGILAVWMKTSPKKKAINTLLKYFPDPYDPAIHIHKIVETPYK